jgi:hypothetical protein
MQGLTRGIDKRTTLCGWVLAVVPRRTSRQAAPGEKRKKKGSEPCRVLVPSGTELAATGEKDSARGGNNTHCCWRLSLREHLISQPG